MYDLGAGAGNVTRLIAARWPQARVVGVDSSAEMLAKAKAEMPNLEWQQADLATWLPPQKPDLIYSNAALHWIVDHAPVFTALFKSLAPGGTFAVQIPRNFGAPSHTSMGEAARMGPWRTILEPMLRPAPVERAGVLLQSPRRRSPPSSTCGRANTCRCSTASTRSRSTPSRPYGSPLLGALDEPMRSQFEEAYTNLVDAHYPRRADGKTLFPFRRMFIVATKG